MFAAEDFLEDDSVVLQLDHERFCLVLNPELGAFAIVSVDDGRRDWEKLGISAAAVRLARAVAEFAAERFSLDREMITGLIHVVGCSKPFRSGVAFGCPSGEHQFEMLGDGLLRCMTSQDRPPLPDGFERSLIHTWWGIPDAGACDPGDIDPRQKAWREAIHGVRYKAWLNKPDDAPETSVPETRSPELVALSDGITLEELARWDRIAGAERDDAVVEFKRHLDELEALVLGQDPDTVVEARFLGSDPRGRRSWPFLVEAVEATAGDPADVKPRSGREAAAAVLDKLAEEASKHDVILDADAVSEIADALRFGRTAGAPLFHSRRKLHPDEAEPIAKVLLATTLRQLKQYDNITVERLAKDTEQSSGAGFVRIAEQRRSIALNAINTRLVYSKSPIATQLRKDWLYLGACAGNSENMLELANDVSKAKLPTDEEAEMVSRAWRRLALAYMPASPKGLSRARETIGQIGFDLDDDLDKLMGEALAGRIVLPPKVVDKVEPSAEETPFEPAGLMRVLSNIGDANTKEGGLLMNRYGRLLVEVPLVGGVDDPEAVWQQLSREFPWMAEANKEIAQAAAIARRRESAAFTLEPILLVGDPGVGKSRYARRVAEICGVPFGPVSLAGATTSVVLKGTERGWGGARPSHPAIVFQRHLVANPLILLDEIDKVEPGRNNGNPLDVLLGYLESETSERQADDCLLGELDCSAISWIMTANSIGGMPNTLLTRVRIIQCGRPQPHHFGMIYEGVVADVAKKLRLPPSAMPDISDRRQSLEAEFAIDRSMRVLKRKVSERARSAIWEPQGPRLVG